MRRMTSADVADVVTLIKTWPEKRPFSWEAVREMVAVRMGLSIEDVWSRQALSAKIDIASEFSALSKKKLSAAVDLGQRSSLGHQSAGPSSDHLESRFAKLQARYHKLLGDYEALKARHVELSFAVSKLTKGTFLLKHPLPNPTQDGPSPKGRYKPAATPSNVHQITPRRRKN